MRAGRLCGFAKVAQQGGGQHVLNQCGLARAADPGDAHQALQGKLDTDVFQVVLTRAFQQQAGCVVAHQALEAHAHLLASAQVGAGQGVGLAQIGGAAVKHNVPAALARAGAHVDHAVGRQHDGGVVLHHHQGVAGVTQALHGHDDAVHVARVQANAGLVQHKQGVDQRGAQRRGEVDALHLAAAQGAALAVEREVANADFAQVFEARGDFFKQQFQGLGVALVGAGRRARRGRGGRAGVGRLQAVKEVAKPVQRQQHQVMQAQARQGLQLGTRPLHAHRHEAPRRFEHGVSIGLGAQAPLQALQLEAGTAAGATRRVTAVLGQQHADVHFVRLGFQVFKKALDAKPVLVPLAVPLGRAVDDPVLLLGGELVPRGVARDAGGFSVAHQVVLRLLPGRGLHGLDGTGAQGEFFVGNHQAVIHPNDAAKAPAGLAGAHGGVEGKHGGNGVGIAHIALRAMQAGRELPDVGGGLGVCA